MHFGILYAKCFKRGCKISNVFTNCVACLWPGENNQRRTVCRNRRGHEGTSSRKGGRQPITNCMLVNEMPESTDNPQERCGKGSNLKEMK